jgi:hypothetical protein
MSVQYHAGEVTLQEPCDIETKPNFNPHIVDYISKINFNKPVTSGFYLYFNTHSNSNI